MSIKPILRGIYSRIPFKQPAFKVLRRVVHLPKRVYQHLSFEGTIRVPVDSKSTFKIHHYGYQVENDLFWAGFGMGWEGTSLRLWARLAQHSNAIFDIGANTGVYALAAKAVNPGARLYAFEPVARIAKRLENNVEMNGYDIEVVVAGASNATGEAIIHEPISSHSYSASLNPDMLADYSDIVETSIAVTRLDDFSRDRKIHSMDLIKVDVEKFELEVLSGFGDLIEKYRPAFLIEILQRELGEKVEQCFAGLDYAYYEIVEGLHVRKVKSLGTAERNYLICSDRFASEMGLGDILLHDEI